MKVENIHSDHQRHTWTLMQFLKPLAAENLLVQSYKTSEYSNAERRRREKKKLKKMPRHIPLRPRRTRPQQTTLKSQQSLPFPQRKRNTGSSHPCPADFQQTNKHKRGEKRWGRTARARRCEGAPNTAGSQHDTLGIIWFLAGFLQAKNTLNVTSSVV